MPTSNSVIMRNTPAWGRDKERVDNYYLSSNGCSEFPAHDHAIYDYVSLGFNIFRETGLVALLPGIFGKDYGEMQHIAAWAKFISEMYQPFEEKAAGSLYTPYTWGQYLQIAEKGKIGGAPLVRGEKGVRTHNYHGITLPDIALDDNTIIGLQTHCNNIRRATNAYHQQEGSGSMRGTHSRCRKVQLGHTAFRFMWSGGWGIPVFALKLKEVSDKREAGLTHLDCLWAATKIKFALQKNYHDYGDLFAMDSGYLTWKEFERRYFTVKLNDSVMQHFTEEQNSMATELGLSKQDSNDDRFFKRIFVDKGTGNYGVTNVADLAKMLDQEEVFNRVVSEIKAANARLSNVYETLKFKFCKPLFKSTAQGVCYKGILKPDSKLNRIVFKDEENSVLSVLRESKFIEILK